MLSVTCDLSPDGASRCCPNNFAAQARGCAARCSTHSLGATRGSSSRCRCYTPAPAAGQCVPDSTRNRTAPPRADASNKRGTRGRLRASVEARCLRRGFVERGPEVRESWPGGGGVANAGSWPARTRRSATGGEDDASTNAPASEPRADGRSFREAASSNTPPEQDSRALAGRGRTRWLQRDSPAAAALSPGHTKMETSQAAALS